MFQVDHLPEVKELADDGDWAIRIPTTVVIELEVVFDHIHKIVTRMILIIMTLIIPQGLAKSGAGFQRAEDASAEHIAQVANPNFGL